MAAGRGLAGLPGHRHPLALRGRQRPATPPLAQGQPRREVAQGLCGDCTGLLPPLPGRTPGETVHRDLRHLSHAREAKVTAVRQQGGIKDGPEVGPAGCTPMAMPERMPAAGPLGHCHEEVGEVDQGEAGRDGVSEVLDACGEYGAKT